MKIIIRDSKGNCTPIYISETAKVSDLREMIQKQGKIESNSIELIFNGMILEDEYSLEELDIEQGSTIDYLGKFLAGMIK